MKLLILFLCSFAAAGAYITAPDIVLVEGRVFRTGSQVLDSYPWPNVRPTLSEHPVPGWSDAREVEAIWEIKDDRLYLIAVSGFKEESFAPAHALGLRDLMPERVKDGKVLADWFTGEFSLIESERPGPWVPLSPAEKGPPQPRVMVRDLKIVQGKVTHTGPRYLAGSKPMATAAPVAPKSPPLEK